MWGASLADFSLDPNDYSQPSGAGVAFDPAMLRRILLAKAIAGPQLAGPPPAPDTSDESADDASDTPVPTTGPYGAPSVTTDAPQVRLPPVGASVAPLARALAGPAPPPPPVQAQPGLAPPGTHYAQGPGAPLLLRDDQDALTAGGVPQAPTGMQQRGFGIGNAPAVLPAPTGTAIAGRASDIGAAPAPQEDATTVGYRAMHDASVASYSRNIAMAQQTAGTPASAVYLKMAEDAAKQANDANTKAIEYGSRQTRKATADDIPPGANPDDYQVTNGKLELTPQPAGKTQILTDDQLTQAERDAGGEWTIDSKTGEREQVSATAPEKDVAQVAEWKAVNADKATRGEPPVALNDFLLQKTMYGKADRPLVDAAGKEIDPSATGDELLQALPPAVANHAKAIAEIREKWPSGTEQARQPQLQQALAAAQQLDPSLNEQTFATRQAMKNSAESGSGRINVANLANNTALFHSSTLADAITALNNSNNTVYNAAVNSGAGPAGGIIPGATNKADEVKQFSVARDAVANELERSFHGVGTTAEQAVKRQIDDLSVNDSPQTQLGALKAAQDLLRGKIEANEADYKDTMGDKNVAAWERDHGRPFGFITPAAQAAGDRVAGMYQSVKAGKGFHGFEQAAPPTQAAAQPARNVAPDVTGTSQSAPQVSPQDAAKLPSGTHFIGTDGIARVRH